MKREIKFRAWDKSENQMSYSDTEFFDDMVAFRFKHWGIDVDTIDDIELMQYTGLKDKNGKEIYEGDIVKGGLIIDDDDYAFTDVVTFDDGRFQCVKCADFDLWHYELEVIGNIYENPELL